MSAISVESLKARQAWADYLALGPDRSLEKLLDVHRMRTNAPTLQLTTLKRWSTRNGWQARLQAITDGEVAAATAQHAAYVRGILDAGFGLAHERVKALNELADILLDELRDPSKRWVTDKKWLGSAEHGEIVEVERFNAPEVEQFRGLLDDIAKEVGGRVRKEELTGAGGGPIQTEEVGLSDDQRAARILALVQRARERAAEPAAAAEPDLGSESWPAD